MMLEELQRRNYAETTTRQYLRAVEDFARRFNRPPDRLGPRHLREYQAELFKKRKLSPSTVTQRLAALRFFYCKTLKKAWSSAETPYPSTSDPQSGGSRTAHRRSSDSLPSQCCQSVLLILRSLRKFWVLNRSLNPEQKRQLAIVQFGSFKPGKRVRPKTLF